MHHAFLVDVFNELLFSGNTNNWYLKAVAGIVVVVVVVSS